ncbi:cyclin-dependent kinase inhibitor 1 [Elaeis guineensis]|uniref:Cyclin-dependent kinase inhibitor n=1 Tax=Elaeis guineensis var. tenera TaxID=51953 RepID=A0A6I9RPN6_ELAGV|nr:cyclin-dependent kinase inhibitor 1 [Elaeis guineensis]
MRKCKGIGDAAVMEVTQVVGVRTRARTLALAAAAAAARMGGSSKRRMAMVGSGEIQVSYLQLRSRSLVMKPRIARSTANSGGRRCPSSELGRISRRSSNASCETAPEELPSPSGDPEDGEVLDTAAPYSECSSNRKETAPSSSRVEEWTDLELTVERTSRRRRRAEMMPSEDEIEEFFAAAERDQWQRFSAKYNYDVVNDAPLEGRYEWFRFP